MLEIDYLISIDNSLKYIGTEIYIMFVIICVVFVTYLLYKFLRLFF